MTGITHCNTDPGAPVWIREQLNAIESAFGKYATTDSNPCGGAAYYDEDEPQPWRVLFADGAECERFATSDLAIEAAYDYAEMMDSQ